MASLLLSFEGRWHRLSDTLKKPKKLKREIKEKKRKTKIEKENRR